MKKIDRTLLLIRRIMNFGNIFMFTITISSFTCTTSSENDENDYLCYCLNQDKKDKFCVLDDNTLISIDDSQNRRGRADLSTGLRLKNYLKATNMLYVQLDEELAKKAQTYANDCPRSQDMDIKQLKNGFYRVQNFAIKNFQVEPEEIDYFLQSRYLRFRRVMKEWIQESKIGSEEKELDGKSNRTNMMRSSTWKIGCGIGFSAKKNEYREHYVCYYETGEINEEKPLYKLGCGFCEDCPDHSLCNDFSFGLCAVADWMVPKLSSKVDEFHKINSCKEIEEPIATVDKDLIWQCNDWKSQNCVIQEMCGSTWNIEKLPGFKVKYCPFQNSIATFLFYKKIYLRKESCFSFKYKLFKHEKRWGSNKLFIPQPQLAIIGFPVGDINELQSNLIRPDSGTDETLSLYLPWKDTDVQVGVSVKSLNADEYYNQFEVEDFKILARTCPNP